MKLLLTEIKSLVRVNEYISVINCVLLFVWFSDDTGAVHPCSPAQPFAPSSSVSVRCAGLPRSGHLWVEEKMLVLLHPPPPRHDDRQPGTDHLDP